MRFRDLLALGLLAAALACRSAPCSPAELEAELRARSTSSQLDAVLELYSPYGAAATAAYARVAREEAALVRDALAVPAEPAVRLYLVAAQGDPEAWEAVGAGGFEGGAFEQGFAFAYVPEAERGAELRAHLRRETLRHELVHLYARRAGLARAKWFNEGLACELADGHSTADGWRAAVYPVALLQARASASEGTLAELLAWTDNAGLEPQQVGRRYALSQALLRFLMERERAPSVPARIRAVFARADPELALLEPEWLRWLAGHDARSAIATAVKSQDGAVRQRAAAQLPVLAEQGAPELRTRAADELALRLLTDSATDAQAATFLLFFRAGELTSDDVERLATHGSHVERLVAQALRARRGEQPDLEAARSAVEELSAEARARLAFSAVLVPGLVER